ncbi:hypothetical protein M378DRAFT_15590 [Amanita muscaria Koide BX008]|uniref:Uncharacterized protein n=1 Tax=Amanita muscaria (strain Koide BX008) TaxID=946122 RepID=A0A0C2WQ85_AMAMK|nr:hypothetical protein M378DRAFT_15590 [Amanita muscaria Koide BX008]
MSTYSTASENSASDTSPAPLPIPPPSIYATAPPGWGGPTCTDEGCTTRWDMPSTDSWSPVIPLDPLVAPLSTPISPAPLPSPLLLPAPPPTQASPSPAVMLLSFEPKT